MTKKEKSMQTRRTTLGAVSLLVVTLALIFGTSSAAAEKVYQFRFANWYPPGSSFNSAIWPFWAQQLNKASNGRIDVKVYPAEQLVKAADTWEAVADGLCDIGHVFLMDEAGRFPLTEYGFLPMLWPSNRVASVTMTTLFNKHPELQAEFKDVHVLWFNINAPAQIFTREKPIKTKEDLKGLKINGGGVYFKYIAQALGFSPVTFSFPEVYDALSKRTVDGDTVEWEGQYIWKWYEQTKYAIGSADLYAFPFVLAMNKAKWESLPKDIKDIFNAFSGVKGAEMCGHVFDSYDQKAKAAIKAYNQKNNRPAPVELTPEVRAEWKELMRPVQARWIADTEKKGLPAGKVLAEAEAMVKSLTQDKKLLHNKESELPVAK